MREPSPAPVRVPDAAVPHQRLVVVFSGLVLAMLLAALDATIVSTALPTIVGELGGLERLAWVVTAYLLAQTIVTPLYGRLGDLYGRKRVLQVAVVVFLVGSALCGMAQDMTQLIAFRAIQGLGGGGLMVTSQAVVGDIVPPRDRGRYQGIFGAVFGVASIAGPLLGGYFTTHLSWRWIFYVNLPLGLVALGVIAVALPAGAARVRRAIDYAGAGLLAAGLAAVVLVADLGGTVYAWGSPAMLALMAAGAAALVGFVFVERGAAEPILPLRLFRNRAFAVTSAVGLIVGFALFGSVTYLPLYLQVVRGATPTESGLQMLPMMGGTLATSILSGQLVSRTGRYKIFPVVGMGVMAVGLVLLSRLGPETGLVAASGMMLLLGLGMGLVLQVLVVAVQNAVDYTDLGAATSGTILFRMIGGSVGTAIFGAVFAARLAANVAGGVEYTAAFASALGTVFLVAAAIALGGFALAWLLPERPLRETVAATASDVGGEVGHTFAMPSDADSATELLRGLAALADRDVQRRYIASIVARAGLSLSPAAAWLLVRIEEDPEVDPAALGRKHAVEPGRVRTALAELRAQGLIVRRGARRDLTREGAGVHARLVAARRARLAEIFAEWPPERRTEIAAALKRLARELVPDHGDARRTA